MVFAEREGRLGADAHNKLPGCQMRKFPTGYTGSFNLSVTITLVPAKFAIRTLVPWA